MFKEQGEGESGLSSDSFSKPIDTVLNYSIHKPTGLVIDTGYQMIIARCISCHSSKLITQNRANREGWLSMIRWMQATQKLNDLGESEEPILNYLSKHYSPEEGRFRRSPLSDVEWYRLKD